ncbi:MAG TPA: S8 family peptidase [Candidatus Acidoferrum sp.]|jgi:subtilisin family serine protease|nr:S8 family peptidase [Candidatus Acidoferrum sp.]
MKMEGAVQSGGNSAWFGKSKHSWLPWLLGICLAALVGPLARAQFNPDLQPDRILVKPLAGANLSALNQLLGAQVLQTFPAIGNLEIVQVPAGATADTLIGLYQQSGLVQYAENDFYLHVLNDPNDFYYQQGNLWNFKNNGQSGGTPGADIRAWEAWSIATSAAGVIVADVDTGIRYTHQDLAANLWVNPADGSHGINVVSNGRAANDPWDDYGHGTHVGGIIGAVGDNGVGVVGVCWRVQLMACKFLDSAGNGTISGAITCLDYARGHGAKVVNASWGSFTFTSQSLHDAIASLRDADIIFVAAAGNSGANNDVTPLYPASYSDLDNVVSVAATDDRDQLESWSDYGATNVDLAAPGAPIYCCWNGSDGDYEWDSGTSMACAHVTGACALLRASFPDENHRQIIQQILSGTDPLATLVGKCKSGGRLDLFKALESTPPPVSPPLPITTGSGF